MPLSDAKVRNAKPRPKPYKVTDGDGLFLQVQPNGSKYWRFKYRFAGREKLLALGTYPEVTLLDARELRNEARKAVANDQDPAQLKKESKRRLVANADNSFEAVAREWHQQHEHEWSRHYATDVLNRLEKHIFPKVRGRPVGQIAPLEVLDILRVIEKSGALDMAQRMMQTCAQVFRYAVTTGRAERNPVADLRGALKTPVRRHHAYLEADQLPEYLQKLNAYDGTAQTRLALKFLLLTFVRTTELRGAEWTEINFTKAEWRIPAERMKMKESHIVPLASQALKLLRELKEHTGHRKHLFPNQHRPSVFMSENTMLYALYRMGYHSRTTGHGFRATASTILNEHGYPPDVIERQLAHCERNKVRAAYNHAQYLPERRKMMQWWADFLDTLGG